MNWNDLKIFLAIVRSGSLRAAAARTNLSISTVSRRIETLEEELGARLFDRRPEGLTLTEAGNDILQDVENLERQAAHVQRKVLRRDQKPAGNVRVTLPDAIVSHLLSNELKTFRSAHPEIDLQLITTYRIVDIMRGDADIALRFTNSPDEHLVGRKLPGFFDSYFASREYLETYDLDNPESGANWIGHVDGADQFPEWVLRSPFPHIPARWTIESLPARAAACRAGLGIAMLPCFIGDEEPILVRLTDDPPMMSLDTWLLVHPALRGAGRARVVLDFFIESLVGKRDLLEGRRACGPHT